MAGLQLMPAFLVAFTLFEVESCCYPLVSHGVPTYNYCNAVAC